MSTDWASDNLQVIRTLMERSAQYRRALAPLMVVAGLVGIATSATGYFTGFHSTHGFAAMWMIASVVAQVICLLLVRRQALQANEDFWTLPCRQVTRAVLPAFATGGLVAMVALFAPEGGVPSLFLALIWSACHGCALNAAGFFMKRGIRLFSWVLFAAAVSAAVIYCLKPGWGAPEVANLYMGVVFGALHVLFGAYLYMTEQQASAS